MMGSDTKTEKLDVELKLLVNLALDDRVSWAKIKGLLDDMTSTYETAKTLNTVLLEELQSLHSKTIGNQSHVSFNRSLLVTYLNVLSFYLLINC